MTYMPRHLEWAGCYNARDLGGLPTSFGGYTRDRALIRTDSLSNLTEVGIASVRSYGIKRIIDLRGVGELATHPNPFDQDPIYLNASVQHPDDPDTWHLEIEEVYRVMLDRHPELYASAVGAIADAPEGGVVVHCAGGKDRTGLVIAMALTLAGVDAENIVADYVVTNERLGESNARWFATINDAYLLERAKALHEFTYASTMKATLRYLDEHYGGVEGYLGKAGLTAARQDAVRDRLVATS